MNEILDLPKDSESARHWLDTMKFFFNLSEKIKEENGIEFIRNKLSLKNRCVNFENSRKIFNDSENRILFEMLEMLCDENSAIFISRVIEKRIELASLSETEKTALYISLEGIFCIQTKVSLDEMKERFYAMLDENHIEQIDIQLYEKDGDDLQSLPQFKRSIFRNFRFKDVYMLADSAIKKVLNEIDPLDLSKALKLSDVRVRGKFFYNMSKMSSEILQEDIETVPATKAEIRIKQRHILNAFEYLQKQCQVYIPLVCVADEVSNFLFSP